LLGVWWKEANKLALIISSIVCGLIFIIISPHVIPSICVGKGLVAKLGMSGGMVTVPLSFIMFIALSMIFNRIRALENWAPTLEDRMVVDRIHGWGTEYSEERYSSLTLPISVVIISTAVLIWGLQPW